MKVEIDALFAADKTPLAKQFLIEDGGLKPISYPHVLHFNSVRTKIEGIEGLGELIKAVGDRGGCLLKGRLDRELRTESRAGHTSTEDETRWICLDIDGLGGVDTVQDFIQLLPSQFHRTSHVIQYSSSMGIVDKGLSAHVFFLLQKPVAAPVLKRWLAYQNLSISLIAAQLKLTRSQVAMRYPLDITTCQNDKLIYVAPAIRGPGVIDQFEEERVQVVKKRLVALKYDFYEMGDEINVEEMATQKMNQIREEQGLPLQATDTTRIGNVEVLKDVTGTIEITGRKRERGFVYLNLNGGDSWGYYHPEDNAKVLYNFKGEPNLDVEAVFPRYYLELSDRAGMLPAGSEDEPSDGDDDHEGSGTEAPAESAVEPAGDEEDSGWTVLVGIEDHSGGYFGVRHHPESGTFRYTSIGQLIQVRHFCREHGVPMPDTLRRWRVGYDFTEIRNHFDTRNQAINLYTPTPYIRAGRGDPDADNQVPELIATVLQHVVGGDAEAYELFLNWLACVVQYRRAIGTAWLLSGTQGTGKGLFFTHIIMPILGRDYVCRATLPVFEKEFNGFLEHSLMVFVDEIRLAELRQASVALSNLKQYITEPVLPIRRMRTDPYLADNHANFVFASNHYDSMEIDPSDRRFLVAPRQESPLSSAVSLDRIDTRLGEEVGGFARYLLGREADLQLARRMYHSSERQRLKHLTRNASDEVADAIREGNFEFFIEEAPDEDKPGEAAIQAKLPKPLSYASFIRLVLDNPDGVNIPRDVLRMVWWHVTGAWFQTPTKFSKFVGKMGLDIKKIRTGDVHTRGLHNVQFDITDQVRQEALRWLAKQSEHVKSTSQGGARSISQQNSSNSE